MTNLVRDLRHAVYTLRRSPGYSLLSIAVLALGIGANSAIFSVLDSVILDALPYPDPASLVFVWERFPAMPPPMDKRMDVARRNFQEWKRQATVFRDMATFRATPLEETGLEHPRHVSTGFASPGLFAMLGVRARLGRLFTAAEDRPGQGRVAVLADTYFEQRFGRRPAALGQSIVLGGTPYTVIGVLPPRFHLPATYEGTDQVKADVWVPLTGLFYSAADEQSRQLRVMARLKPGVSVEQARRQMAAIADRLAATGGDFNKGWATSVFSVRTEDVSPQMRVALFILMGAVGFLLLIACANLANLTLARATLRSREIALRLALGASRTRIVAQLASEALLLSFAGAAAGLLLANWCVRWLVSLHPEDLQRPELVSIDASVFAFAAVAAVFTTMLFGLAPAMAASRLDLNSALKSGGGWGASAVRLRNRQFLIGLEVALALMLVVGAGLMIRSFQSVLSVGVGFRTQQVSIADIDLPEKRYPDGPAQARFFRDLLDRARSAPGIAAAAITDAMPLHRITMWNFFIAGHPEPPVSALPIADMVHASPGYFGVIGLRLEAGRLFTEADRTGVAVVNQSFAKKFFPGENPLGQHLLNSDKKETSEIVGVVSDYRAMGIENGTRPTVFWSSLRVPSATLVVRSAMPAGALAAALRNVIWSADKELPAAEVQPMQHYVDEWLSQRKFTTLLLAIFAGLALVLGMMGIYGVLGNLVASRVHEIGIRMAIGASPAEIGRLVLRQGLAPVTAGLVVGLAGSLVLGRFLESLLFQVHPRDPATLLIASAAILLISPVAIVVPLRRATRVDCTVALREE